MLVHIVSFHVSSPQSCTYHSRMTGGWLSWPQKTCCRRQWWRTRWSSGWGLPNLVQLVGDQSKAVRVRRGLVPLCGGRERTILVVQVGAYVVCTCVWCTCTYVVTLPIHTLHSHLSLLLWHTLHTYPCTGCQGDVVFNAKGEIRREAVVSQILAHRFPGQL